MLKLQREISVSFVHHLENKFALSFFYIVNVESVMTLSLISHMVLEIGARWYTKFVNTVPKLVCPEIRRDINSI